MLRPLAVAFALALGPVAAAPAQTPAPAAAAQRTAHAFAFEGLLGGQIRLADYRGKAVLIVNTATECGYTPQLGALQRLAERKARQGLVVIGVPSNDFGGQEPRQGQALADFCALNYGVTFPMAARTPVTGAQAHPFYRWAAGALGERGVPRWNFHKLLIGPDGRAIAAFDAAVPPEDPRLLAAIDRALPRRT